MPLLILALGVALLIFLMLKLKLNGVLSLTIVAILVGVSLGMPLISSDPDNMGIIDSITTGVGKQATSLALLLAFGSMLGVLLSDSGAASRLATTLLDRFGLKYSQIAIILVAFIIGVTLFWESAWIILIPLVYAATRRTERNVLWLAIPLAIALSSMHSFLPPHPGPSTVAGMFGASLGKTLVVGLPMALVIGGLVAWLWPRTPMVRSARSAHIPEGLAPEREFSDDDLPGYFPSLCMALLPVVLIATAALVDMRVKKRHGALKVIDFLGNGSIALMIGVCFAILYLRFARGVPMDSLMKSCSDAIKTIAGVMMLIMAGGGFSMVLQNGGISKYVLDATSGWNISPLILGWAIAALMRVALGSASVAIVAAAGIVTPLVTKGTVNPELMTLAVASGSVMASHVNDPGFWMFKEFLGLSVADTLKVRTTYTSVLSVLGLGGVMVTSLFVH